MRSIQRKGMQRERAQRLPCQGRKCNTFPHLATQQAIPVSVSTIDTSIKTYIAIHIHCGYLYTTMKFISINIVGNRKKESLNLCQINRSKIQCCSN